MIKSANQYPVHTLFSHEGNVSYRIPPYQREYSWRKSHWEDLFEDLVDADGAHFLGTIITLDQTTDTLEGNILQVVDGQQRLTTLTILLAAVYALLQERREDLDDDTRTDLTNLGRLLVRKSDGPVLSHCHSQSGRDGRRDSDGSCAQGSRGGPEGRHGED